jgi:hypothetical protein
MGRIGIRPGRAALAVAIAAYVVGTVLLLGGFGFGASSASADDQYQYGGKVTICHHTGSAKNPTHTIVVDEHALDAHLAHGDTIGPCPDGS